jgi:hypothetical protein
MPPEAGLTKRSDIQTLIPEILAEAVQGQFAGMKALAGSPVVVTSPTLPYFNVRGETLGPGDEITVPYFGNIGEMADVNEGDSVPIRKLSVTDEKATVRRAGLAFEITTWARDSVAPNSDPYNEAARQLVESARRKGDAALLEAARATDLVLDIHTGTPKTIDYDALVDALGLWGDEQVNEDGVLNVGLIVCHSKILSDFRKVKDANGLPLFTEAQSGQMPRLMGIPVKVSDRLTPSGDTTPAYDTLLVQNGALVLWYNDGSGLLTDVDILKNSKLGAYHYYHVAHRYKRLPGKTKTGVVKIKSKTGQ